MPAHRTSRAAAQKRRDDAILKLQRPKEVGRASAKAKPTALGCLLKNIVTLTDLNPDKDINIKDLCGVARNDAKRHRHVLPAKFDATVFTIIVGLWYHGLVVLQRRAANNHDKSRSEEPATFTVTQDFRRHATQANEFIQDCGALKNPHNEYERYNVTCDIMRRMFRSVSTLTRREEQIESYHRDQDRLDQYERLKEQSKALEETLGTRRQVYDNEAGPSNIHTNSFDPITPRPRGPPLQRDDGSRAYITPNSSPRPSRREHSQILLPQLPPPPLFATLPDFGSAENEDEDGDATMCDTDESPFDPSKTLLPPAPLRRLDALSQPSSSAYATPDNSLLDDTTEIEPELEAVSEVPILYPTSLACDTCVQKDEQLRQLQAERDVEAAEKTSLFDIISTVVEIVAPSLKESRLAKLIFQRLGKHPRFMQLRDVLHKAIEEQKKALDEEFN